LITKAQHFIPPLDTLLGLRIRASTLVPMNTPIKISVESESARETAQTPNGNTVQSSPESYSDPENGRKDEYEKLNSDYQIRWNDRMEISGYKSSSFYLKVSVLLIAWGEDFDDLGTKKEVRFTVTRSTGEFTDIFFHHRLTASSAHLTTSSVTM
jgi:hypothetical protein